MKPNLIKDIEVRTKAREKAKQKYDNVFKLSATADVAEGVRTLSVSATGQTVRLLDEGMVVSAEGYPLFYIKKGTLQAYYNALSDDYVGSINVGHQDFATFPFLVGEWTKADLTVVDIGDGRKGLDVTLRLDTDSVFIKELQRNDYPVGVSAEFGYHIDEETSNAIGLETLDKIDITNFAIVGEAGNVGSSNIELGGKKLDALKKLFEKVLGASEECKGDCGEGCTCGREDEKNLAAQEAEAVEKEVAEEEKAEETSGEEKADGESVPDADAVFASLFAEFEEQSGKLKEMTERAEKAEAELAAKSTASEDMFKRFASLGSEYLKKQEGKKKELAEKNEKKMAAYEEQSEDGMGVF